MTEYKKVIAQNKKALFNYFIEERLEAGIVLKGSEVQSLRQGKASIEESHATDTDMRYFCITAILQNMKKRIDLIMLLVDRVNYCCILKR